MRVFSKVPAAVLTAAVLAIGPRPGVGEDPADSDGPAPEARREPLLRIQFAVASAKLDSGSARQLDALASALTSGHLRDKEIGIYGHTDATGDAKMNRELARERARSVRDHLVNVGGVDPGRLTVRGFGEARLRAPARPAAAVNRRVAIVNLDAPSGRAGSAPDAASRDEAADSGDTPVKRGN